MKQTIEIEVPDGKMAVWKDGKIVFEDAEPQLPKTWEEYCEKTMIDENEVVIFDGYLDRPTVIQKGFIREPRNPIEHKKLLPSEEVARQFVALMQLYRLRNCYRQGWIPNWDEGSNKYVITQKISNKDKKHVVVCYSMTPWFLSFPTYKLAEEFLTNFRDLIEQAGDLI